MAREIGPTRLGTAHAKLELPEALLRGVPPKEAEQAQVLEAIPTEELAPLAAEMVESQPVQEAHPANKPAKVPAQTQPIAQPAQEVEAASPGVPTRRNPPGWIKAALALGATALTVAVAVVIGAAQQRPTGVSNANRTQPQPEPAKPYFR